MIAPYNELIGAFERRVDELGFRTTETADYRTVLENQDFLIEFPTERYYQPSLQAVIRHKSGAASEGMGAWDVMAVLAPTQHGQLCRTKMSSYENVKTWLSALAEFLILYRDSVFVFPYPYKSKYDDHMQSQMKRLGLDF